MINAKSKDWMWCRSEVLEVVSLIETKVSSVGWHVALTGSVLTTGYSDHDLDLVFFPHDSTRASLLELTDTLANMGWRRTHTKSQMQKEWRKKGSTDQKHVEVWRVGGKRVDVIILGDKSC